MAVFGKKNWRVKSTKTEKFFNDNSHGLINK